MIGRSMKILKMAMTMEDINILGARDMMKKNTTRIEQEKVIQKRFLVLRAIHWKDIETNKKGNLKEALLASLNPHRPLFFPLGLIFPPFPPLFIDAYALFIGCRDEDDQGDYEEATALQFAEQEEEDLNRIKEESRRRRQAILEKYKSQQPQQPNEPQSEDVKKGTLNCFLVSY